ncbi:MAG: hypothetical protein VX774_01955, partial [Candidatus Thermoplasmatota archaeon]|nr:hypothetical protein [Candidatus Thermoplasmatota archaeon]
MVKTYNTSKSNTKAVQNDGKGGPDDIDIEDPVKTYNTSKSNTSSEAHGGGGGGPDIPTTKNYNSSKSNTSSVSDGDLVGDGGGPGEPAMTKNYNSSKSNTSSISVEDDLVGDGGGPGDGSTSAAHEAAHVVQQRAGSGTGVISSTFRFAKTILMAAVLLTAAGVGFDLYHTYNDAIDLNLEDHVTNADFALN